MKVISYSRVSTNDQDLKPQIYEIARYCEARGWEIIHEISDHGFTGSNDQRPGLKELIRLVKARKVDAVVIYKLDRIFRSLKHLINTLEEFQALGIQFVAIKDQVDYTTPSGRLFVQMLGSLAEFERELIKERVKMGLDHAKRNGVKLGRPFIGKKAEILELKKAGKTYREISKQLSVSMGVITKAIR